jgi:hypothetical protein
MNHSMPKNCTVHDEIAFAKEAEVTVEAVVLTDMDDYREMDGISIHYLRRILDLGYIREASEWKLNKDLTQRMRPPFIMEESGGDYLGAENLDYFETGRLRLISDDDLLRRYYHSCLAGEDLVKGYVVVADVDRRDSEGRRLWSDYCEYAYQSNKLPISQRHAKLAHELALGASWLHQGLAPYSERNEAGQRIVRARIKLCSDKATISVDLKMIIDSLSYADEHVFVTDFKTVADSGDEAVMRRAASSRWAMKAYAAGLIASKYAEYPVKHAYVVSSIADRTHSRHEVDGASLEQGREMFIRAVFRNYWQRMDDKTYFLGQGP